MRRRLLLAWLVAVTPGLPSLAVESLELRFSQHLGVADIRLAGARASRQVEFAWPLDWRAQQGAVLRLRFQHSPTLDFERSFLAVSLNHGVLRSLRLEPRNAGVSEVLVPIPPEMIREENQLVVSVEQSSTAGGTEGAWTLVRADSSLAIPFERRRLQPSLTDLPEPLLRRRSYEARRLAILLPQAPSAITLEATALVVASMAARVAPEPVRLAFVRSPAEAGTPLLVVGTPKEQPALRDLGDLGDDAKGAAPTVGVVALLSEVGPGSQPSLVVTGREPEAVRKAALALFGPARKGSRVLLVPGLPSPRSGQRREWRGFIPPTSGFSLHAAGDPRAELSVTSDLPARVRLKAPPDARFLPWGHRATLVFEALPGLGDDPRADLEVYWNDVLLRQVSMQQRARARSFTLSAPIPASALRPENVLTVAWNGRSGASGPFVALRAESTLFLPREYAAEVPDLGLLRRSFYPFGLRSDLSETVIGVAHDDAAIPALCELAALLGRVLPSDRFAFRVARLAEALGSHGLDAVLLETAAEPSGLPLPDTRRLPRGDALARLPFVQELESPRGDGRHLLRIRAPTTALLRAAARSLGEPTVLDRLTGDTAFLAADGPHAFPLAPRRTLAETSHATRLEAWMRGHWLAMPLILAAISGLLFAGLRLLLGQRRAARRA